MSIKKLAIFDMDGTILDSIDDIADSVNFVLNKNNFPLHSVLEIKSYVGNGIHKLIERALPNNTDENIIEKVYEDFKVYYKEHSAIKTKAYDGIIDLLNKLKGKGIKIAVNSNKADFAVQDLCIKYFPGLFDFVLGEKEGIPRKPYADGVNLILKELNCTCEQTIYIGDSEVDVLTASNAHVDLISVSWGFRDKNTLKKSGASTVVDEPAQILNFF